MEPSTGLTRPGLVRRNIKDAGERSLGDRIPEFNGTLDVFESSIGLTRPELNLRTRKEACEVGEAGKGSFG